MKMGIIGLPLSGKTTVFNAVTGSSAAVGSYTGKKEANLASIKVTDERVDFLTGIYNPKRVTYAEMSFMDVAASESATERGVGFDADSLTLLRTADGLTGVVRAFDNPAVPLPPGGVDPRRDLENLIAELIVADLIVIEKRIARLVKERNTKTLEFALLERCKEALENEIPLRDLDMTVQERVLISPYSLLTLKPMLVVINISETDVGQAVDPELDKFCADRNLDMFTICGAIEMEIGEMEPDDRIEFLRDMGLDEPANERYVRAAYSALGLISFLTVGPTDVRAWPIRRGATALEAAGKIHSDIERGFIRAEVVAYDDFVEAGDMNEAKHRGKLRLEGKEYIVQDGDIMLFRFNV
ncbi:MAG: redox-regulated ATPase YchF [Candidatus Hydrogenedentes bacterium]|nr:redox-regulated ATPase YchF [Candidatus Hydrogenedentota bacterium]